MHAWHDRSDGGDRRRAVRDGVRRTARPGAQPGWLGRACRLARCSTRNSACWCRWRRRPMPRLLRPGAGTADRARSASVARARGAGLRVQRSAAATLAEWTGGELFDAWWRNPLRMQRQRDNPSAPTRNTRACADYAAPGLVYAPSFDADLDIAAPFINSGARPRVAILREQGVNGQLEMAAAFDRAGFEAVDVHMSDLDRGRRPLADFHGLAACGGFSYGDVLGAGRAGPRASSSPALRDAVRAFFARPDTFALGRLQRLPDDERIARSGARCGTLAALPAQSLGAVRGPPGAGGGAGVAEPAAAGMAGSRLPVAVSHGEGRAEFDGARACAPAPARRCASSRRRPRRAHLSGQPEWLAGRITGFTTTDGRVLILMPHPERVYRSVQLSWARPPADGGDASDRGCGCSATRGRGWGEAGSRKPSLVHTSRPCRNPGARGAGRTSAWSRC
jgi:phosphoribosylformylglycinamidine synthase